MSGLCRILPKSVGNCSRPGFSGGPFPRVDDGQNTHLICVRLEIVLYDLILGNGRSTVSRVLLRRRELTEFCGKLGEFCEKLGEFAIRMFLEGWFPKGWFWRMYPCTDILFF